MVFSQNKWYFFPLCQNNQDGANLYLLKRYLIPKGRGKGKGAAPAAAQPAPNSHGGWGRNAGRKRNPENTPGIDDPAAPPKIQKTMADLFGPRFAKKTTEPLVELIEWKYVRHDGGEDDSEVVQKQRLGGRVQYDMEKEALAIVLDKGPEIYYVDKNDQLVEVDATHDDAERRERNGGMLKIQIEIDGALQTPVWVTCGHVQAVEPAGATGGAGGANASPMPCSIPLSV